MLKDNELRLVKAITVSVHCVECDGEGHVPTGDGTWLKECPYCRGSGAHPQHVTIAQLKKLLERTLLESA